MAMATQRRALVAGLALVATACGLAGAPSPAAAAGWARIAGVGTRTVAVAWSPAAARASLPYARTRRVEAELAAAGRWHPLDPTRIERGRLVLRTLTPSRRTTIRLRACAGGACGGWVAVRTRTLGIPKGAALPRTVLGPLPPLGIMDSENAHTDAFAADAEELGLALVRVVVRWNEMQRDPRRIDFSSPHARRVDAAIRRALADGRQVVITVDGPTPAFAIDPTQPGRAPRLDAWRAYVLALARRYRRVLWWETWNEPNAAGAFSLYPYRQLQLASVLRRTVRRLNPDAQVLLALGSGRRTPFGPARQLAYWRDYVRFAADYGVVLPAFDAISFHPYNRDLGVGLLPQHQNGSNLYESGDVGRLLAAIDEAFPGEDMPLAITEFGHLTGPTPRIGAGLTPEGQADALCGTLSELRRWNRTGRILMAIWYLSRDERDPERAWTSGLRYADGTPKPAFDAWRRYVADPPARFDAACPPAPAA